MRKRTGHGHRLTKADRFEIQRRVAAGEPFSPAAAAVGCSTKSIQRFMRHTGGMRPKAWNRSSTQLSLAEREEILRGEADRVLWIRSPARDGYDRGQIARGGRPRHPRALGRLCWRASVAALRSGPWSSARPGK